MEKAGVWWCSIPHAQRIRYAAYVDNMKNIESRWSRQWGDRYNEIVFIGQDIDKEMMILDMERCLLQESEQHLFDQKHAFADPFLRYIA